MNKVFLIGRLTRDPEHRTTPAGAAVCRFTLAVDRSHKNADGSRSADFLTVIAWRQLADLCARYLAKGKQAAVVGQLQSRSYDAQDGSKRYVTEVIADEVQFLSPVTQSGAAAGADDQGFAEVDDDELPF